MKDKSNSPLVSVIIPCYNYGCFLSVAIDSIINQIYNNWECIIVDDGSTDNTKEIAESYIEIDDRIRYFFKQNGGLSSARNFGIKHSNGEFIQLLDADDFISSTKLSDQIELFMSINNVDVVYCDYLYYTSENNSFWKNPALKSKVKGPLLFNLILQWESSLSIPIHCLLIRKSCFTKFGLFNENLPTHEDFNMHYTFFSNNVNYYFHFKYDAFYRIHQNSMARNYTNMFRGFFLVLFNIFYKDKVSIGIRIITLFKIVYLLQQMMEFKLRGLNVDFTNASLLYSQKSKCLFIFMITVFLLPFTITYRLKAVIFNKNKQVITNLNC